MAGARNVDPWELLVVTGEALERFKEENRKALLDGETSAPDIPMPIDWPDMLKKRRTDLSRSIYESINVDRDDAESRIQYYADLYHLFDAPALILFVIDRELRLCRHRSFP